jgi:ferredoxin
MKTYKVTLIDKNRDFQKTIDVPETEAILMEAFESGIKLPFECVVGACGICQGKIVSGTVDPSEQIFLSAKYRTKNEAIDKTQFDTALN